MTSGLVRRVNKLEGGRPQGCLPLVIALPDESPEKALARWRDEHPDKASRNQCVIVCILVERRQKSDWGPGGGPSS